MWLRVKSLLERANFPTHVLFRPADISAKRVAIMA